jgi:hypothetical protein
MKKSEYLLKSLINALGVLVYVSIVAWLLFNGEHIFDDKPSFLIPVFMLLLFIISASITSLLVLGKPIHLYLSGLKKEAFTLLFTTLAWLVLFIAIVITVLFLL